MWKTLVVLALAAQAAPSSVVVGTWTLSSVERVNRDGRATPLPLPRRLLVLDRAGHAFELVETGRRVPDSGNQPTPAEALTVVNNYSGFWGGYAIDAARKTITYRPDGAISPNAMGQEVVRTFELNGDQLRVTATDHEPDGQSGTRWTWDRMPQLGNLTASSRRLVGFWRHVVERRIDVTTGAVVSETQRAPSVIVYSPAGYVGVHFPPMGRANFANEQPTC